MATAVVMPKQGQTVESCIIVEWKKQPGDTVAEGDALCDVETDKATIEVVSPAAGTLLAHFFAEGDDVPVLTNIAAIGTPGESFDHLHPEGAAATEAVVTPDTPAAQPTTVSPVKAVATEVVGISPRARAAAQAERVETRGIEGSGPGGRILERDVLAAAATQPRLSPVAKAMVEKGGFASPSQGSGPGGRVMARDLAEPAAARPEPVSPAPTTSVEDHGAEILDVSPVRGVRKVIADRMLGSLQNTAQLTMHSSADARPLLALRKRFKESDPELGLQGVTVNDLVLFAVARTLPRFPDLNAVFKDNSITRYRPVHLGFAVDTPRGLLVPVILRASQLSLRAIADESKRLATAAQKGTIAPDELVGGTFTVTNLGSLGVEQFTPILNAPQVAILGVGSINLKPVQAGEAVEFTPHIGLSLTVNHQVVDGAPGARFLQALAQGLAQLDLLLAL
jgi:pyruvate dehydrogenase E2 component (dihydrolipoamide acetyltransferase)